MPIPTELDVLRIVCSRLDALGRPYMLTGSFALAYYATPRMTRDLDLVVELSAEDVPALVDAFAADFYVDAETAARAVADRRLFNLMHLASGVKVDLIVRKDEPFRRVEFERRDVRALLADAVVDLDYLRTWAPALGVAAALEAALRESAP